jgi:hypothetical protein
MIQATSLRYKKFQSTNFYHLINTAQSIQRCKDLMEQFQQQYNSNKPKKLHRRVISSSLHDTVWAILRILPATMEDMKVNQPKVYQEAVETGKFFVFTNSVGLSNKMNDLHNNKELALCPRQIRNIIKRLMEIGIITEKVNYNRIPLSEGNPLPSDKNPNGRGQYQLFINPEVLEFGYSLEELQQNLQDAGEAQTDTQNQDLKESFPLDCSAIDFNTELILNEYPNGGVDSNVSPNGAATLSDQKTTTGQGLQDSTEKSKNKSRNFLKFSPTLDNLDYFAQVLWKQAKESLYGGYEHNAYMQQQAIETLKAQLKNCAAWMQVYRSEHIERYCASATYNSYNPKKQVGKLRAFASHLPQVERGAVELISRAIQKQKDHCIKKQYEAAAPHYYFAAKGFEKALFYAQTDFRKLHKTYYLNNAKLTTKAEILGTINNAWWQIHTTYKQGNHLSAMEILSEQQTALKKQLKAATILDDQAKQKLFFEFQERCYSIFKTK